MNTSRRSSFTTACEMEAIGLAIDGKIPNNSFTASSYFNDAYYKPSFGRLKGSKRGWAPKVRSKDGDYLQIDLLYEYVICAVATQGANGINEWTKSFKIQLSLDGTTFDIYQEDNNDMDPRQDSNLIQDPSYDPVPIQDPLGSYMILQDPTGSWTGFSPGSSLGH
ncbi:Neuropilin-2 [Stylophora pistillata]|uniref:Neuropilin-2 n=1 Tax=Stylophora pistillata TaxID=50429 RepID=A0A2B4SNW4_STYPI|nr:Neuropilin-2 [Stylophora pistillata]